jgi:hypothetical protein
MSFIIVGGQSSNVGKTTIAAGLIASIPECRWTAIKLTICKSIECPVNGPGCACQAHEHPFSLVEEKNRAGRADSIRFLASGAQRSFWGQVKSGFFESIVPEIAAIIAGADHKIVESNSLVRFIRPDLYITVLHPGVAEWKSSARELLPQADIAVIIRDPAQISEWPAGVEGCLRRIPKVYAATPALAFPELADIVRERLTHAAGLIKEGL